MKSFIAQLFRIIAACGKLVFFYFKLIAIKIKSVFKKVVALNITKKQTPLAPSTHFLQAKRKLKTRQEILELFNYLNLTYIGRTQLSAQCQQLANIDQAEYLPYNTDQSFFDGMAFTYAMAILEAKIAPLYIKWVNDKVGYGCYAAQNITLDTLIGEYTGEVQLKATSQNAIWSWNYPCHGNFSERYAEGYMLNASKMGNEMRFVNHSDKPNCTPHFVFIDGTWCIVYIASRCIKKNEEILVSYGKKYWTKRQKTRL